MAALAGKRGGDGGRRWRATITGATEPRTWGASGLIADVAPHVIYGVVMVIAYEAFTGA